MSDWQFYPTPEELARKAWGLFYQPPRITRLLEPSAGRGDLLLPRMVQDMRFDRVPVDVIEIDIRHHPILKERGFNVLGTDFLQSQSLAQYSHVIMNPPFNVGARHVLHAYDHMLEGEIVAILNAETLRNPYSAERERLSDIVNWCGAVEFVEGAFLGAERKTAVDVAIVHLSKYAERDGMVRAWMTGLVLADKPADPQEVGGQLALPRAEVENLVIAYNAAVEAATEAATAIGKREYYKSLLGKTIHEEMADQSAPVKKVQADIGEAVTDLRTRAWSAVLNRTSIADKLSTKARERLYADFEDIKLLDFTLSNIGAFVSGILESQGDIQIEMMCDVFDLITRYHSKNGVFYRGWKSNDKHRTCGMKLRSTRFILPLGCDYSSGLGYKGMRTLDDIDKTFCLLAGNRWEDEDDTMANAFKRQQEDLYAGERVTTEYFDIRFYSGAGTVHFFSRRPDLVDRLNRVVGAQRQWLPPEGERVSKEFWLQYDKAEKYGAVAERGAYAAMLENHPDHEAESRKLDRVLEERQFADGIRNPFAAIAQQEALPA